MITNSPCRNTKSPCRACRSNFLWRPSSALPHLLWISSTNLEMSFRLNAQELLIEHLAARSVVHTNKAQREEMNYKDVGEIRLARSTTFHNVSTRIGWVSQYCKAHSAHTLNHQSLSNSPPFCMCGDLCREALSSQQRCSYKRHMPYPSCSF